MSFPTLIRSLFATKSASVTVRYITRARSDGQTEELGAVCRLGFLLDLGVSTLAFLLMIPLAGWVATQFLHLPNATGLIILFAASFPLYSFNGTSSSVLLSFARYRWIAAFQLAEQMLNLLAVGALLLAGFRVSAVVAGTALSQAAIGVMMLAAAAHLLREGGVGSWWRKRGRAIISVRRDLYSSFGWNYLVTTFAGALDQVPVLLVGRVKGSSEAGYYRLASSIATIGSYFEQVVSRIHTWYRQVLTAPSS